MSDKSTEVTFNTDGMVCTACEMLIESTLSRFDGIEEVKADYAKQTTTVTYDAVRVNPERMLKVLEEAGYEAAVLVAAGKEG